jgi:hypothetical protein
MYILNNIAKTLVVGLLFSSMMYAKLDLMKILKPLSVLQQHQFGENAATDTTSSLVKNYFSFLGVNTIELTINQLAKPSQPSTIVTAELSGIWINEQELAELPDAQQKFLLAESVVSYALQHPLKYDGSAAGLGLLAASPLIAGNIKVIHSVVSKPTTLRYVLGGLVAFAAHKILCPILNTCVAAPLEKIGGKVFEQESITSTAKMLAENGQAWVIDDYMKIIQNEIGAGNGNLPALNFYATNSDIYGWLNTFTMEWKHQVTNAEVVDTVVE